MTQVAGTRMVLDPTPPAHFGAGAVDTVAGIVTGTGCQAAVIVTDQGLAGTAVVASVADPLAASGLPVTVFTGVRANPTTGDVAAGADTAAALAAGGGRPGTTSGPSSPAPSTAPARSSPPGPPDRDRAGDDESLGPGDPSGR
jgi:hypothetical protein